MFTEILHDLHMAFFETIHDASPETLGMMGVIALFAGLRMSNLQAILGWTFESTALLGAGTYLWNWLSEPERLTLGVWQQETLQSWNALTDLSFLDVLGYMGVFFIGISVIHIIRMFARR